MLRNVAIAGNAIKPAHLILNEVLSLNAQELYSTSLAYNLGHPQ